MVDENREADKLLEKKICERAKDIAKIIKNNNNVEIRPAKNNDFIIYEAQLKRVK